MTYDTSPDRMNAIADFYQLMAIMFRLPHDTMVEGLVNGDVVSGIKEMSDEIGFTNQQLSRIEKELSVIEGQAKEGKITLTLLRQAYTKAFTHPKKPLIFPYESQFLFWEANPDSSYDLAPRLFVSDAALDTERCYKKAGLKRSEDKNFPGDYLPTELEFLGLLYDHMAKISASSTKTEGDASVVWQLIREFDYYHLKKWGVDFFKKCIALDFNPTYTSLAIIAAIFIEEMLSQTDGWSPA